MKHFYKILLIITILLTIGVFYSCKLIEPMENKNPCSDYTCNYGDNCCGVTDGAGNLKCTNDPSIGYSTQNCKIYSNYQTCLTCPKDDDDNRYFSIDTDGKLNCDKDTSNPANKSSCTAEPNDSPPGAGCGFNGTPPIKPTQDNNWLVCKGVD
tara:strand:+ start:194 stop:652 length:459 start_codon:yes stop_codon:yes gene_type:complete